jgi:phosphatidate phosphatase APP1
VISEIDDTIKVTQVQDRKLLLRRTFLEPFKPVPGMAEIYRAWAEKSGAQFCYVSASPWQLFLPLSEFMKSNGFPGGVFYLKKFRWKDESFLSPFESPEHYKPAAIEPLLKQFPRRQFVLVGDAEEQDPEIYAGLARRYPQQIARILIRDATGEPANSERYQTAFRGLPPGLWQVFRAPAEIADSCPLHPGG